MKFYGTPNSLVKERRKKPFSKEVKKIPLFRFDKNGEYTTSDDKLIQKLKKKFKYEEEVKLKHCKKCNFTCNNQGELLAHYREIHPKEE
jgi:hypothetical protein